jgi:hypothetical protein
MLHKNNEILSAYPREKNDHRYLYWIDDQQNIIIQSTLTGSIKIVDMYFEKKQDTETIELRDISNYHILGLKSNCIVRGWDHFTYGILTCYVNPRAFNTIHIHFMLLPSILMIFRKHTRQQDLLLFADYIKNIMNIDCIRLIFRKYLLFNNPSRKVLIEMSYYTKIKKMTAFDRYHFNKLIGHQGLITYQLLDHNNDDNLQDYNSDDSQDWAW